MSDILERVRKIVIEHLDADPEKVTEKASFIDDLGADSLDNVELVMAFEEEFDIEIPDDAAEHIQTVGDAVKFIGERLELAARRPHGMRLILSTAAGCSRARGGLQAWRQHRRMRRVVVTGIGLLTPLGQGPSIDLAAILAGKSGAGRITTFDPTDYACQVACEMPRVERPRRRRRRRRGSFNPDHTMAPKDQRRVDDFILYAIAAADEAVKDSGWVPQTDEDRASAPAVIIGSGIGGLGHHRATPPSSCTRRARAGSARSSSPRP